MAALPRGTDHRLKSETGPDAHGGQAGTDCLYSGGFGFTFKVALLRRTSSLLASSVKVTFTLIFMPTTASVAVLGGAGGAPDFAVIGQPLVAQPRVAHAIRVGDVPRVRRDRVAHLDTPDAADVNMAFGGVVAVGFQVRPVIGMPRLCVRMGVGHFPGQDAAVLAGFEVLALMATGGDVLADVGVGDVVMPVEVGAQERLGPRVLLRVVERDFLAERPVP